MTTLDTALPTALHYSWLHLTLHLITCDYTKYYTFIQLTKVDNRIHLNHAMIFNSLTMLNMQKSLKLDFEIQKVKKSEC